jgi:replication factor C subunit 3/5
MSQDVVDETSVYLTSGAPLPQDMETILDILMNQNFKTAYERIVELCTTKGYALADVLHDLTVMVSSLDLPSEVLSPLLDGMSNVEYRLASGTDEKLQTASLVGVFVQTRELTTVA